jgi:methionyl-tRNA formyltransferase
MRLAFMGTPEFALTSLRALLDTPAHDVLCAVTQPDKPRGRSGSLQMPPVKELALARGIPVLQPEKLKRNEELLQAFKELDLDAAIVVAYGKMIPDDLLAVPRHGFVNVHASLLPRFRGAAPINRAILEGCGTTGVSIMQIDSGMDSGPVFLEAETPIAEDEDAVSLSARLSRLGADKLLEVLYLIGQGRITAAPQDSSEATLAPMLTKEEGEIDWSRDVRAIHDMVRGLLPWPCAYTSLDGRTLKIMKASYTREGHGLAYGTLCKSGAGIAIAAAGGLLIPGELQLEGKKAMDSRSFANGLQKKDVVLGRNATRPID